MMRSHIVICLSLCLFLSTILAATPEPIRCKEDKCATVRCATGPCVMDSACNPVCTTPAPVTTSTSTSTSTPTPTPTPTPTTTPEPLQCRIMGGAVPPQCPKTYVWDSTICKFVCCPNACPAECEFGCNEKCECKQPRLGETVRTISFRLRYESSVSYGTTDVATVVALANAMRDVGDVGGIPRSDYIINNDDFKRIEGRLNSKSGKWSIKIGFRAIQHPDGDRRKEFVKQLKLTYQENLTRVKINAADNDGLLFLDETEEVIEAKEFYEFQTCQDGRTITADKQCEAVTFAATAAATSSSTSIPIVAIIAPIIGGIVLIAIIATALIIRRRRADNVKTMENIARDTADMETNPAIAAVQAEQVEGADRV